MRSVVRGKIVKINYFKEQGLEVFLEKLKSRVAGIVHKHPDGVFSTELGKILRQGICH